MKIKKLYKIILSVALLAAIALNFTGCGEKKKSQNLSGVVSAKPVSLTEKPTDSSLALTDFAVKLFRECEESGKNTLISPLSVLCALSMTANGADGETLTQMENVLGMKTDELNAYIYDYLKSLSDDENAKLKLADSIWFRDDGSIEVKPDFLQRNADYYNADIFKSAFDSGTLKDVNDWVSEKTNGMIPNILDQISDDSVMYLINALAFEAEWSSIYYDHQVEQGKFTLEDGTKKSVEYMNSDEHSYLQDELATGFIKYYKGGNYAFVAMLPNKGVSVSDYVDSLSGKKLNEMLANPTDCKVITSIPKFEYEYKTEMSEVLKHLGMTDAFDWKKADFSKLGESKLGNIYINRVIHKTFISVAEKGTKAGAATLVELECGSALLEPEEIKTVKLNRPFVYMLIDCESNVPFFIGTVMDI